MTGIAASKNRAIDVSSAMVEHSTQHFVCRRSDPKRTDTRWHHRRLEFFDVYPVRRLVDDNVMRQTITAPGNPNDPDFRGPDGEMPDSAQLAPLTRYLSDGEFPVRIDTIRVGDFRAYIGTVWLAKRRSFHSNESTRVESRGPDPDVAWAAVRAVVTKNEQLISNSIYEVRFSQPSPKKVLLEDLTGDGIKEYAYYERHISEYLYIWNLSATGVFQPLRFLSHPGAKPFEQLDGMKLCVEPTDKGQIVIRAYNAPPGIAAPHLQEQISQETYRWDATDGLFIRTNKIEGRKADFYRRYKWVEEEGWPGYTFSLNNCN